MDAKSGRVFNVELVLRDIGNVDIISWNSLIAGYALNGYGKEAVELLEEMLMERWLQISYAWLVAPRLKLFKSMTQIHKIEPFLEQYACMVDLLGWAERLEEALKMVLEMKVKATAGLSGALLGAARIHRNMELVKYATEKLSELEPHKASNYVLLSYIHAEVDRWNEVERIRVTMSKRKTDKQPGCTGPMRLRSFGEMGACVFNQNLKNTQLGKSGRIEEAIKVFSEMTQKNIVTYNSMISTYAKNGEIRDARHQFDKMPRGNFVSWNTMMAGYLHNDKVEEAYEVFLKIPKRDLFSWTLMITYCTCNGELQNARELFNLLLDMQDSVCWNAMIVGYAMNGLYEEAKKFFYEMPIKNLVSWNSMLAGYTKNGEMRIRLLFFKEMAMRDLVSWNLIVDGFIEVGDLDSTWKFFMEIPEPNVVSWLGYDSNGRIVEAQDLFEQMPSRNVVSWNAMLSAYVQDSQIDRAVKLFSEMLERDSVSWTTMINRYLSVGKLDVKIVTSSDSLQKYCRSNIKDLWFHDLISKSGYENDLFVSNTLITMDAKSGRVFNVELVLRDIGNVDIVSWNSLIVGYALNGYGKEAVELLEEMLIEGWLQIRSPSLVCCLLIVMLGWLLNV
ncbi:Tetratricopeptide-like helical domain containing protein [Trema orientale]|uniref:Tetratricopeptide-like helical domain containing protein n=1 Tax=Trema orientale TaxID=63057 RepID=A0A2P5DWH5_TREOI|nr:Tetratricopeptide-like helical domain containing protein [Trema orientale]